MTVATAEVVVRRVGADSVDVVGEIVQAAFVARPALDPPADALVESREALAARLGHRRGVLAELDGRPVGALVLDPSGDTVWLRRVAVLPGLQQHGVAHAMVAEVARSCPGFGSLAVMARQELPGTVRFWEGLGFVEVRREAPYVELRRRLPTAWTATTAEEMQGLGEHLGSLLNPGELVVLTGGLGAGKTTLTQGLGAGLGVRGGVTSPTFVIARVHPSLVGGPALVHVDAYRLGGITELDDLDLDTSLEESVTVVEWGAGLAEGLAERRLEITIERAEGMGGAGGTGVTGGAGGSGATEELDPRQVTFAWA